MRRRMKNVSGAVRDPDRLSMRCVIGWPSCCIRVDAPVLVGYSMGGRIAAGAVVRYPNLPLAGLCF